MQKTPTQRTIRALQDRGLKCAIVEKWNGHIGIRQDLFGIIDIIALDPESGVIGVQSCGNSYSAHLKKFREERLQECLDWINTPGTSLELWAWRKTKKKLKKGWSKGLYWQPRVSVITEAVLLQGNHIDYF